MASNESITPAPVFRHPLGLPAGSVRATLALMIAALFWLLLLLPPEKFQTIPLYLYLLLGLVLLFFGAHGHTIVPAGSNEPAPWHLPSGTFRWAIVLISVAVVAWRYMTDPDRLLKRLTPPSNQEQLQQWPYLLLAMGGGFSLGWIIRLGPWRTAYWWQDIQAWISLLAMLFLGAEILIRVFVNPNLETSMDLRVWECVLVAVVSFYFGVRCR